MSSLFKHLLLLGALVLYAAGFTPTARAHSMYQAALLLDFRGKEVEAELQLPLERMEAAVGMPLSGQMLEQERTRITAYVLGKFSAAVADGRKVQIESVGFPKLASIEGAAYVVAKLRLIPPIEADGDLLVLHCSVLLDRIPSQVILVSTRTDWRTSTFANDPQLLGVLRQTEPTIRIDRRDGNWWRGFSSIFRLGMRHIAEGTDHLLFLLTLLLPAPLLVVRGWWAGSLSIRRCLFQIGKVVTAFTVGHSLTLALGAMDLVHIPSRPIETLIAVSIFVSAIHAFRPVFPGREAIIAGAFGLIHGLAFATTLSDLGLGRWERIASIVGFNLGIEAMQLVVVFAALPALILLSHTPFYKTIRTGGAVFSGIAALAWIAQRLWNLPNPMDAFVTALAQQAVWFAVGLTVVGIVARNWPLLCHSVSLLDHSTTGPTRDLCTNESSGETRWRGLSMSSKAAVKSGGTS